MSQNVANASTPGYAAEIATQQSIDRRRHGLRRAHRAGRSATSTRPCRREVFSQNATVAGLQTRQTALQAIDAVQGTPGQGTDIASLLGNLQNQFSTLLNDPSNAAAAEPGGVAATTLAQSINTLSNAYTAQRQTAQDDIVAGSCDANTTLGTHRQAQHADHRG